VDSGLPVHFAGPILHIGERAEVAYIDIGSTRWFVCSNWKPLWRCSKWEDCYQEGLYAVWVDDSPCVEGQQELESLGFEVAGFEGF